MSVIIGEIKIVEIIDGKGRIAIPRGVIPPEATSVKFKLEGKVIHGGEILTRIDKEYTGNYNGLTETLEIPQGVRETYYLREGDVISVILLEYFEEKK